MSVTTDRSLFAAKGRASAAGARPQSGAGDDPSEAAAAQPALVQTDGGAGTRAAVDQQPGSLLAFRLRSAPGKSALTGDMMTALSRPAGAKAPAEAVPATNVAHAAPPAVEIPPAAAVEITPAAADAAPAPATEAPAPAPAVSESPGGRIDQPAFPQSLPRRRDIIGERGAARPPAAPAAVIAIPPRPSTLRTVLPAAAAVAAIAVVGWLIAQSDPVAPEAPAAVAEASPIAEPLTATDTEAAQTATGETATADADAGPETLAPPPAAGAEAADIPAATPTAMDQAATDQAAADPTPADMPVPTPTQAAAIPIDAPSFELVRAEPGAPPVLAGRAAPGSLLLVLDNGAPIGTATADLNGEWALVGDAPLSPGRHELSLALKTPEGSLVVEQADADMAPGPAATTGLPIPAEKPTPGAAERSYVVQLASVPSPADATREWARLQQAYPALLGQREVTIDAAEIGGRGTFYRIRTGPFSGREAARGLCRELNGAGQECLVVRGASES